MPRNSAKTPAAYLASLPAERRREMAKVRSVIKDNLPEGYRETMCAGLISYEVPLSKYPDTYNGQALWYVALAAQKNYLSLYLMGVYGDSQVAQEFKEGFRKAGKKLDMGKSCVHFQKADDLALDAVGKAIAAIPMTKWIAIAQAARRR